MSFARNEQHTSSERSTLDIWRTIHSKRPGATNGRTTETLTSHLKMAAQREWFFSSFGSEVEYVESSPFQPWREPEEGEGGDRGQRSEERERKALHFTTRSQSISIIFTPGSPGYNRGPFERSMHPQPAHWVKHSRGGKIHRRPNTRSHCIGGDEEGADIAGI